MSGTTMSTPSSSASGNIRPASMTMISSPHRTAMQFIPNSPRPPSGTRCSFPAGIVNYLLMLQGNDEDGKQLLCMGLSAGLLLHPLQHKRFFLSENRLSNPVVNARYKDILTDPRCAREPARQSRPR